MENLRAYWRQFVESAIVFANRTRNNLLLKTHITLVATVCLVCAANIVSLAVMADLVGDATQEAIFERWGTALVTDVPAPSFTVLDLQEDIDDIERYYLALIGAINLLGVLFLGAVASRFAIEPTRDAISAQRNFIAHTAHELRTPLSIARTNIEVTLLDKENVTTEAYINELERTLTELDALAGIINNLVMLNTLTNLEAAEYHYHDLDEVVREVVESYREYVARKSLTLSVESAPGLLVWSNRNALKQMVGNLLGNAINFTNEHGAVTVRAFKFSSRHIRLMISDTGIGIAHEELAYIFKPFYRSPAADEQHESGSGLGLAIVRELVRLHSGRIRVQSVLGEGTSVTVDLPIVKRARVFSRDRKKETDNTVTFNYSHGKEKDEF